MRPPPPKAEWGKWDELPPVETVENPTPEQSELMGRIDLLRSQHDGWFGCPSPEYRQWLLRRSYESVKILQNDLRRLGRDG